MTTVHRVQMASASPLQGEFPIANRVELCSAVANGLQADYLMFPDWGGQPPIGWLAPFCPTPFESQGMQFPSAEHWLMHAKALLFGDLETAARILRQRLPMQAQQLGRNVRNFDESLWEHERERIMFEANLAKFSNLPELRSYLLSTWPMVLVQASAMDDTWGSGLDLGDPMVRHPTRWPGQNLGGFSLMQVRQHLRSSA